METRSAYCFFLYLFLFLFGAPTCSRAVEGSVVPGSWRKVESLEPGRELLVRLKSGECREGRFLALDASSIHLQEGAEERSFPRVDVKRIESLDRRSGSAKRGTLIGLVIGGGAAAVFGGLLGNAFGDNSGEVVVGALIFGGIGAGVGAAAGYGISKLPLKHELIYEASN